MAIRTFGKTRTRSRAASRKRPSSLGLKKKICRLCADKVKSIDYKDKKLETFVTDRGKILSSRVSGACAKHQRRIAEAIKRARFISLVPYRR